MYRHLEPALPVCRSFLKEDRRIQRNICKVLGSPLLTGASRALAPPQRYLGALAASVVFVVIQVRQHISDRFSHIDAKRSLVSAASHNKIKFVEDILHECQHTVPGSTSCQLKAILRLCRPHIDGDMDRAQSTVERQLLHF